MLARFRKLPDEHLAIIAEFLTGCAGDIRDEAAKLPKGCTRHLSGP
jgi:hypothetical protein